MMFSNKFAALAIAATFGLSATSTLAEVGKLDADDFVKKASVANLFEIESSKLAVSRTSDIQVKQFAEQMIADHTKAGEELKAALAASKVKPTALQTILDDNHKDILEKLQKSDVEDFDEDYLDAQKKAHKEAVSLFEEYVEEGTDPSLTKFAATTLPVLKQHDTHVNSLEDKKD